MRRCSAFPPPPLSPRSWRRVRVVCAFLTELSRSPARTPTAHWPEALNPFLKRKPPSTSAPSSTTPIALSSGRATSTPPLLLPRLCHSASTTTPMSVAHTTRRALRCMGLPGSSDVLQILSVESALGSCRRRTNLGWTSLTSDASSWAVLGRQVLPLRLALAFMTGPRPTHVVPSRGAGSRKSCNSGSAFSKSFRRGLAVVTSVSSVTGSRYLAGFCLLATRCGDSMCASGCRR